MQNSRKDIVAGAVLLGMMCVSAATAQSLPDKVPASVTPPPSTSFFPLEQVHRGLHGTAYTVFEGTQPEAMEVEILGVLHNAIGPHQDMILARLHGTKPEYTGVVAGMSGSPVYIDGKLVGALAYRIGEFSKEPIAGITPIGEMLKVRDEAQGTELRAQGTELRAQGAELRVQGTELRAQGADGSSADIRPIDTPLRAQGADGSSADIRPIDTPLVFTGFGSEAVAFWKEHASGLNLGPGLTPVAGIGGSSASTDAGAKDDAPAMGVIAPGSILPGQILPGSAVSAVLVRGDLEIAATCTVTYVDPKQLLACGHPITQFGPVSIPMTKADVVATLASPYNAFKIINTSETIGSFTQDRETAIKGVLGERARMIPLTVHLAGDGVSEKAKTLHLEVVDQEQITPAAVMVSVFQSLMQTNGYAVETTYRVRGTVKLTGYPAVKFERMIAPSDLAPANLVAALLVGEHFNRLYANAARLTPIESVEVDVDALAGRQTVAIESVQAGRTEVRAGDTVSIEATVRPWRGEIRNIRIPVTLPATLPDGPVRLLVSDGATLDRLLQPPQIGGSTLDVAATIAQLNSLHASDRLYVTLLAPDAQVAIEGRTLTALPLSMANVMEPVRENRGMTLSGESAVPLGSVALGAVLSGQQVLTLRVE